MTEDKFYALQNIYRLVAQLGSTFGSEDTASGLVIPTGSNDLTSAIASFFPASYQERRAEFSQFENDFCQPKDNLSIEDFLAFIKPLSPEFALVGKEDFDPQGQDRGEFYLCLFLPAIALCGTNLLLCFNRAET